jgi:hypothetical protein
MPLASTRRIRDRASSSTTDSTTSPHPTPSRSSGSSDGLPLMNEPNTYELQPISHSIPPSPLDKDDDDHNARRLSFDSVQSYELYTPDEDKTVLKKLDRRLVGFMALLYCLSFLDRTSE